MSDAEVPTPTEPEVTTVDLGIDEDGHVISTNEFPTPKVVTQHYDGTTSDPDYDPSSGEPNDKGKKAKAESKVVESAAVETKTVQ